MEPVQSPSAVYGVDHDRCGIEGGAIHLVEGIPEKDVALDHCGIPLAVRWQKMSVHGGTVPLYTGRWGLVLMDQPQSMAELMQNVVIIQPLPRFGVQVVIVHTCLPGSSTKGIDAYRTPCADSGIERNCNIGLGVRAEFKAYGTNAFPHPSSVANAPLHNGITPQKRNLQRPLLPKPSARTCRFSDVHQTVISDAIGKVLFVDSFIRTHTEVLRTEREAEA